MKLRANSIYRRMFPGRLEWNRQLTAKEIEKYANDPNLAEYVAGQRRRLAQMDEAIRLTADRHIAHLRKCLANAECAGNCPNLMAEYRQRITEIELQKAFADEPPTMADLLGEEAA